MHNIFETKYLPAMSNNNSNISNTVKSTRSMLDLDFDDDDKNFDELECYISEKPANKDIDVFVWWKVTKRNVYPIVYWIILILT